MSVLRTMGVVTISEKRKKVVKKERKSGKEGGGKKRKVGEVERSEKKRKQKREEGEGWSAVEVKAYRAERSIFVQGDAADAVELYPLKTFEATKLSPKLLEWSRDFQQPTPIQSQCWPIILHGKDLIGIAKTGSGKTFAFCVPGVSFLVKNAPKYRQGFPQMLVLAPTRELAKQSAEVCTQVGQPVDVRCACVYGGAEKRQLVREVQKAQIVVATPGRLLGMTREGTLSLEDVSYLVLDEADRMLDMGFEPDVREIVSKIGRAVSERQTVMFSATWPEAIQKIAHDFMQSSPIKVTIGSEELEANDHIKQVVEVVEPMDRDRLIDGLIETYHAGTNRVIIFVLYKKEAARIERMLRARRWNCVAIHGDMHQNERFTALESFRSGSIPLLIATDVAARGLDIPKVEAVINFTFPLTVEDYVHRIGRTGRAGKAGLSHTVRHHMLTKIHQPPFKRPKCSSNISSTSFA